MGRGIPTGPTGGVRGSRTRIEDLDRSPFAVDRREHHDERSAKPRLQRRVRTRLKGRRYRLYLFGSRARKEGSPRSDYDLALLADPPLDLATLAELREALEGLPILQPLDLVELSWAPGLKEVVEREGILLDEGREA